MHIANANTLSTETSHIDSVRVHCMSASDIFAISVLTSSAEHGEFAHDKMISTCLSTDKSKA